jgi:hypothetical protein
MTSQSRAPGRLAQPNALRWRRYLGGHLRPLIARCGSTNRFAGEPRFSPMGCSGLLKSWVIATSQMSAPDLPATIGTIRAGGPGVASTPLDCSTAAAMEIRLGHACPLPQKSIGKVAPSKKFLGGYRRPYALLSYGSIAAPAFYFGDPFFQRHVTVSLVNAWVVSEGFQNR